jgi:hypothetical protein
MSQRTPAPRLLKLSEPNRLIDELSAAMAAQADVENTFFDKCNSVIYPCDPRLATKHGNTLLTKALEMINRGEGTFTDNHYYCSVFDKNRNMNVIIKFPTKTKKSGDNDFVADAEGLYD